MKAVINFDEWRTEAKIRFNKLPIAKQEAISRENVEYAKFKKPTVRFLGDDSMLKEIVDFIEEKTLEYDKFLDKVNCGDDWFIIYETKLAAMNKILEYAKEQKNIYDKQTAKIINRDDFNKDDRDI